MGFKLRMVAAACAALAAACAPAQEGMRAKAGDAGTLIVGNKGEDTVSFIDLASGAELARLQTGHMPHEIAISPDGKRAAVVAYGGASIDIFDVNAIRLLRRIDLSPNQGPHGLVWLPDGRLVATTERSKTLTIVDTRRKDAVSAVPTAQEGTHMVAVSGDLSRAYTANIPAGTVTVIDLAAGRKLRRQPHLRRRNRPRRGGGSGSGKRPRAAPDQGRQERRRPRDRTATLTPSGLSKLITAATGSPRPTYRACRSSSRTAPVWVSESVWASASASASPLG